ncbi:MAG: Elongation factor Ts [candidate division WWE3 bacterium GW2011_GWC1_41_7]|uniref:Elongation factor Ts n=4 Tax=Katanobacteria TaxID=422282 RepID=A0A0G0XCV4_UNCKA|nr:MAG: Elongation factor Ts [candidate division WWE3 bacterium GW2011_GWB1_41_6]KKS18960.1 MAG: Elongation factor Ts [candidate division WWE3 bacterium GW2011_GWC1_41_7]KKS22207.1 MAG: Elongation factor Ts [candidate division WWE3 bacterium GW2011_GWA1_41_8]OGC56997.1 MAG: translation elongation factor Ts [candidate division WWE3 bacterium RIFCSPLOWO2_01_FULL_41_9]
MIDIEMIKKLREETGAGMLEVKQALEEHGGDYEEARNVLAKKGAAKAAKKQEERTANDGLIQAYIHAGGKVGSLVHLSCETDFVAKTDDFKKLCTEIAMQVAAGEHADLDELLNDEYLRDPSKKISDLITEVVARTGEKIELRNFCRFSIKD